MIVFAVLGAGFANTSPTFLISCEVQTRYLKTLKYSGQYIRDHLSDTKVRIWICSEYDAVFNFSYIASCNLTKSSAFSFTSFLSKESDYESFKQSTCTLDISEMLLFKVSVNECKLTREIPIYWSFFVVVWWSVNSLSVAVTDWTLSWSSIQLVCLQQRFSFTPTTK